MLQTQDDMGACAWDGHGEDDGGRANGNVLRVADMAKCAAQVHVTGTARM